MDLVGGSDGGGKCFFFFCYGLWLQVDLAGGGGGGGFFFFLSFFLLWFVVVGGCGGCGVDVDVEVSFFSFFLFRCGMGGRFVVVVVWVVGFWWVVG